MADKTVNAKSNIFVKPSDNIFPNRKGKISLGFNDELIEKFTGRSEYPSIDSKKQIADFHFFDELQFLQDQKLTGGSLQTDIRTDRYIWGILDYVYSNYYTVLGSCDSDETWTGDSTAESVNYRAGDEARKLESTASLVTATRTASINLSTYDVNDYIDLYIFVQDSSDLETLELVLTDGSAETLTYDLSSVVSNEWNSLRLSFTDFTDSGVFDFSDIASIKINFENVTGTKYIIFDEIRAVKKGKYPQRIFDIGLQYIPVAWWGGNSALYEIKIACESESARFYSDEQGILRFENRQHYNVNSQYKSSVWLFNFNNQIDLKYLGKPSDIINKVVIKLKPRKIQSEKTIWQYGFTPLIEGGETKTIWADFTDPVPTTSTGLVTPVATTDYTAHDNEDGSGTVRTADLSITITKFSTSAKLEIENTSGTDLYLTFLKLRGTPAEESDESRIIYEDTDSIAKYDVQLFEIENKYMADEGYAQTLAEQLVEWYKSPIRRLILKNRAVPQLQVGDMITVTNEYTGINYLMRITRLKEQLSDGGFNQEIHARAVTPFELLDLFTINVSSIESGDIIAP